MNLFDVLTLIGGLSLFLFGMNLMGNALERSAGSRLQNLLGKMTTNKFAGLFTGIGVTAVIQSSSATTVMVVGFVNSGLMTLKQAINVIVGANIGTTVTAWILSLAGIESSNVFVRLLNPSSFTPILAAIGIILYMFCKKDKKKDTGMILLGFAVLMFGMDTMTNAVSGLSQIPEFRKCFVMFSNPILGVLAGTILTAIIQSSSASVGILQALANSGVVTYGTAIPIIMGQNIGTCITAILSSFGTNLNAKRAALVHLSFNVIGTIVWLSTYCIVDAVFAPALFQNTASLAGIAVAHSLFNILCTLLLLPLSSLLEKLAYKLVPENKKANKITQLDERLLLTPAVAVDMSKKMTNEMAEKAVWGLKSSIQCLLCYDDTLATRVREEEQKSDWYEDTIGTYIVKLSAKQLSNNDSVETAKLLKVIGDLERISDHSVYLVKSAEEIVQKKLTFSKEAREELCSLSKELDEIMDLTLTAFTKNDLQAASLVKHHEKIINIYKEQMRNTHILRLQQGTCSIENGFVWSDILTSIEHTTNHCSNIAGCVLDAGHKLNSSC